MSLRIRLPALTLNQRATDSHRARLQIHVLPAQACPLTPPAPGTKQDVDQIGQIPRVGAGCGQGGDQSAQLSDLFEGEGADVLPFALDGAGRQHGVVGECSESHSLVQRHFQHQPLVVPAGGSLHRRQIGIEAACRHLVQTQRAQSAGNLPSPQRVITQSILRQPIEPTKPPV